MFEFISSLLLDQSPPTSRIETKKSVTISNPLILEFFLFLFKFISNLLLDQSSSNVPRRTEKVGDNVSPLILEFLHRQRDCRSPSRLCALMQSIYRFHPILLNPLAASCASIADSYCPTRRSDLALFASLSPRDQSPCWARCASCTGFLLSEDASATFFFV
ncbi:hypothetical protein M431DRAFT_199330 [Trichoderma harzianum CBS 226.95]|uniref:Uncharacterized protein n=1 Tax=Trichoderma harzianum CBS 226.95 TaxID=983964 RepID=A0A2T4AV22_TRIHA|nr:hypothetical protein M431DRAFT_199330 [Trichoderma harzianum CBS 226.95]PTB60889.1 hypothetical protein M431DRAFT_199330 [Trichoderma harzianum CBS 226.95]